MFDPHIYARQPLTVPSTATNTSTMSPHGSPQKKHTLSNLMFPMQDSQQKQQIVGDENQMVFVGEMGGSPGEILTSNLISNDMNRDVDSGAGSSGQASRKTSTIASSDYASSEYTPENTILTQQNVQFGDGNAIDEFKKNSNEYQTSTSVSSEAQLMVDTMSGNTDVTPDNAGQSNLTDQNTPLSSGGFNLKLPPARKLSRFIVSPVVVQTAENQFLVVAETSQPRSPPSDAQSETLNVAESEKREDLQEIQQQQDEKQLEDVVQRTTENVTKLIDPVPQKISQPSTKAPAPSLTLEELKKQLEDITHVHVSSTSLQPSANTVPPPIQSPAPQQVQSGISVQQQEKIKQEIQQQLTQEIQQHIQQQIQQQIQEVLQMHIPTSEMMQVNNANIVPLNNANIIANNQNSQSDSVSISNVTQNSGPGSALVTKENTSVYNSRRTSTDMTQAEVVPGIINQAIKTENVSQPMITQVAQPSQAQTQLTNTQVISDPSSKLSPQHSLGTVG